MTLCDYRSKYSVLKDTTKGLIRTCMHQLDSYLKSSSFPTMYRDQKMMLHHDVVFAGSLWRSPAALT